MRRNIRVAGAVLAAAVTLACARPGDTAVSRDGVPNAAGVAAADAAPLAAPAAPDELRRAEAALGAYLEAARDGSPTAYALDSLTGCGGGDAFVLPITLLAAYRVLPAAGGGDTLTGRAIVVTAAEQRADRRRQDRYLARRRVQVDTLEWDLVRDAEGAGWEVCNGLQFGFHEPAEQTDWYPLGASRASARTLADSLHRAWSVTP